MDIELTVSKSEVLDEVAQTTAYVGSKAVGDDSAYARIFTSDEDRSKLERFWLDCCSEATALFKPRLSAVSPQTMHHGGDITEDYVVTLEMSSAFDSNLQGGMQSSLFSYFVESITAEWLKFTGKDDVAAHTANATAALNSVREKFYYRKRPTRINVPNI